MRTYLIFVTFSALVASTGNTHARPPLASVYTDISGHACIKHVDDESSGANTLECPGIQGFRLQILEDDERSSVNIVTPNRQIFPLDYWEVVTRGFSTLGTKAEWRVARTGRKVIPVAIIVRINTLDQSNIERPRRVPILAIAKISKHAACVTQTIDANSPNANEQARRIADDEHLPCLHRQSDLKPPSKG